MSSIFTKIIKGEIPSFKVYEDELVIAFMDVFPMRQGHVLVVPKIEVDYFLDVPEEYYQQVFKVARLIVPAIEKSVECIRVGMHVEGIQVPHFHLHLIPIVEGERMVVQSAKGNMEELEMTQKRILNNL